jgi:ribosomal protein S18 acetylase RimI-like enzyme
VNVTFRIATVDDAIVMDAHPPLAGVNCHHADELADGRNTCLLGLVSQALVAHGFIRWTGFTTPEFADAFPACAVINILCVWPESMHRRGIGTAMVGELEKLISSRGGQRAGLGVYVDNVPAIAFYESLGYALWDGRPVLDEHTEHRPDGLTAMTKPLR